MPDEIIITPDMTVRDVNIRYPACREVFNLHGMGGCGGKFGPPEPIDFFAKAHNVPLDKLLEDLRAAAASGGEAAGQSADEKLSTTLYKQFVWVAIFFTLTLGTAWGVYNLTIIALSRSFEAPNYAAVQGHGHAQTFGWVGLFIMGVAYYTMPKFKGTTLRFLKLAKATLPLMVLGILARAIAQPLATNPTFGLIGFAAAVLEIAVIAVFVALMLDVVRRAEQPAEFYDKFVYASLVWFLVLGGLNLAASWHLWQTRVDIIPDFYNLRILHTQVFGFIVNVILGVSLRILPNFIGLRQPLAKPANAAFWLFNAGIALRVIGLQPLIIAAALELLAVVLYIHALGILTRPVVKVQISGVDDAYEWFVRLAYPWLLVTVVMILLGDLYQLLTGSAPPHPYIGAYRHAVTVGFISTLMMGVAYRILPIFSGTQLHSPRAMRISFWFLAIGNLFRVGWQLGTLSGSPIAFAGTGLSGYLELTAMIMFGWNIIKTLKEKEDEFLEDQCVRPTTRVADILDLYPETRETLIEAGLSQLGKVKPPRFVTLEFAARRHGVDPQEVADKLNATIHPGVHEGPPATPPEPPPTADDSFRQDHQVRLTTPIAHILDLYPQARAILVEAGFAHLKDIPKPPDFVTIEFAAQQHGLDAQQLMDKLNEAIQKEEVKA
jgi:uncharacterized protein involved in response to NO